MLSSTICYLDEKTKLLKAWENYVYYDKVDSNIRPEILQSWQRCKELNVDPMVNQSAMIVDEKHLATLMHQKKDLIRIAKPYITLLNGYVKDSGFIIILSDELGTVLVLDGDEEQIYRQRQINLIEGATWSEREVGTNALGTSLFLRQPMQVVGEEHYCINQHSITCSGSPIYGSNGQLEGVLNMSGASENVNIHTLGMVVAAAVAIENQLKLEMAMDELSSKNLLVNTTFENIPDGIITIDDEGKITTFNNNVAKLLGIQAEEAINQNIKEVLPNELDLTKFLQKGNSGFEIMWNCRNSNCRINLSSSPMYNNMSEYIGSLLVLRPKEQVHKLVNQVTGAHAKFNFDSIIGNSRTLRRAKEIAHAAATTNSTVLLLGESGTGKELFAQAIHQASARPGAFIAINCSAIPRSLIESELFGYESGAFTGANRSGRPGKFERADNGTILLDEIGDMPLDLQSVLLRVLQEKSIVRVGGYKPIAVNARVIGATNSDLVHKVEEGSFREDLYFRLNVITIQIPPLRERKDDIPKLVEFLLPRLNKRLNRNVSRISPNAIRALQDYEWPGNVRELENTLERSIVVASRDLLDVHNLPSHITGNKTEEIESSVIPLQQVERNAIKEAMRKVDSIAQLSRLLGISRSTLYRKMKEYGLE